MHINEIKQKWIEFLKSERRVSNNTIESYERDIDIFLHFLKNTANIKEINSNTLETIDISTFRSFITIV